MITNKYPWLHPAVENNTIENFSSGLLIEGEAGLAKSKLANYFAKKLLCLEENQPCDSCHSCSYFEAQSHPDFCFLDSQSCSSALYSYMPKGSKKENIVSHKVDGIRALNDFISLTSSVSKKRVAILFDAHLMNVNAQNALLKTLEDSSLNKHIILVSNKRRALLPTIYSRCALTSIQNPPVEEVNIWLTEQGYIDHSALNFSPDSTPLLIESLIESNQGTHYQDLVIQLNAYCKGDVNTFDLIKFFKDLNISFEEKVDALIQFLKNCLGITTGFYKANPMITSLNSLSLNTKLTSELIEEMVQFKVELNKVPSLNEQIGLSHFIFKIQALFR